MTLTLMLSDNHWIEDSKAHPVPQFILLVVLGSLSGSNVFFWNHFMHFSSLNQMIRKFFSFRLYFPSL